VTGRYVYMHDGMLADLRTGRYLYLRHRALVYLRVVKWVAGW